MNLGDRIVSLIRRVFGPVERKLPGEPGPLLDAPPRTLVVARGKGPCTSGCAGERIAHGCPVHDPKGEA